MVKQAVHVLLVFIVVSFCFAGFAYADEAGEIVTETSLRQSPESPGLSGLLTPGTPVIVVEKSGEWIKVRIEGWVRASSVSVEATRVADSSAPATPPVAPAPAVTPSQPVVITPSKVAPATVAAPSRTTHPMPDPSTMVVSVEGLVRLNLRKFKKSSGAGTQILLLPPGIELEGQRHEPEIIERLEEIAVEAVRLKKEAEVAMRGSNFTRAAEEHDRLINRRKKLLSERQDLLAVVHGRHEVIARNVAVASSSTDSRGWFSISVPPGQYTIYARMTFSGQDVEWIEPVVVVDQPLEINLDEKRARGLLR